MERWTVHTDYGRIADVVTADDGRFVCSCSKFKPASDDEVETAILISSAPDMLSALRNLLWATEDWDNLSEKAKRNFQMQAREALAKAEGRDNGA